MGSQRPCGSGARGPGVRISRFWARSALVLPGPLSPTQLCPTRSLGLRKHILVLRRVVRGFLQIWGHWVSLREGGILGTHRDCPRPPVPTAQGGKLPGLEGRAPDRRCSQGSPRASGPKTGVPRRRGHQEGTLRTPEDTGETHLPVRGSPGRSQPEGPGSRGFRSQDGGQRPPAAATAGVCHGVPQLLGVPNTHRLNRHLTGRGARCG